MIPYYIKDWFGIKFSSFTKVSSTSLPTQEFYREFYKSFFESYSSYSDLEEKWLITKSEIANYIRQNFAPQKKILSVGCGLGYVETLLYPFYKRNIHVYDYASESLSWLRNTVPISNIYNAEAGLTHLKKDHYDLIYLSAVDYAMPDGELIAFLEQLKEFLCKDGVILVISASFLSNKFSAILIRYIKQSAKLACELCGLCTKGQLWGFMRSQKNYAYIFINAGLRDIEDGFLKTPHQNTYLIMGRK